MKRAISERQRAWLHEEAQRWRDQNILAPEQSARILDLYEGSAEIADRQHSRALFTLMGISALLVGLAALLLIGYNWEAMPRAVKLAIVFGVIIATHATAFYLRYKRDAETLSEVAFFLGCLFYGAGIWLIAQIFNLSAHYPDAMWWWALGVLPFALCLNTLLLHTLLVGLLAIWAGVEVLNFTHLGAWFFGRWNFLPNGAYSLPLLALPGLLWAYRRQSPLAVGLYVPVLAWWVILQPFAWQWDMNPVYFIGAIGAFFLIIAESHRSGSPFAIPYRLYGVLLVGGALVFLSFYEFNEQLAGRTTNVPGIFEPLFIVGLTVIVIAAVFEFHRRRDAIPAPGDFLRRQWLPVSLLALMVFLSIWHVLFRGADNDQLAALLPTILANIAMIACALWLVALGLREDRGRPFAAGVIYFLLWAFLRYIDLFGDFGGMLGAAAVFFLCGATLFGVAMYWRKRKALAHV
ncbi:MAG: DUF2157 domain-containing protein [Candidatus Hydrogenedentales bacterium]